MVKIRKIISGGQAGVDRAAFDFALARGIEIGGYVPKDRRAEDGRISEKYPNLTETATDDPAERTELNVKIADATIILSRGSLVGGSRLTKEFAEKYQKPFLHIDFARLSLDEAVEETREWLALTGCQTLNVAGPRASEDAGIYEKAKEFLEKLFNKATVG